MLNLNTTFKHALCAVFLIVAFYPARAQTKVFKEVSEDISSQLEPIFQDGKVVGYLFFTTLEKSSADSFNYRLSLMDENLNDIGTVNFSQEHLDLKEVSFEQDILCLAYIKSNFAGKEFKNGRQFRRETANAKTSLFTQFVDLNGKVVATNDVPMDIRPESDYVASGYHTRLYGNGKLKQSIQLRNIQGKGFACFFGDDNRNNLLVYNTAGKQIWQKQIKEDATDFTMLTSGNEIDLLVKRNDKMLEGGYSILGYNADDATTYPKFLLTDRKGNALKVLTFNNDPVSGKPFVSGMIIDPDHGNYFSTGKQLAHGPYCGVFEIGLNGHTKKDIHASFSYWADGSQSFVDKRGYFQSPEEFANVEQSFRDYSGNTYYAACGIARKLRVGGIVASVVTLPLIFPPIFLMAFGTHKYTTRDVLLLKQDSAGRLSLANTVPEPRSMYVQAQVPMYMYDPRSYYTVANPDTRSNFLVINTAQNIDIYNIGQNRVARSIPHKDGNSTINVLPAKEGYVMVYEINKKEKTTRLSIESL